MSTTRIFQFLKLAAVASLNIGVLGTAINQSIKNNPPLVPPSEKMSNSDEDKQPNSDASPHTIRNRY